MHIPSRVAGEIYLILSVLLTFAMVGHGNEGDEPHIAPDRTQEVSEGPQLDELPSTSSSRGSSEAPNVFEEPAKAVSEAVSQPEPNAEGSELKYDAASLSPDADPELRHKQETVKEMMKHAWNNYKQYAWGKNELRSISKRPHLPTSYGNREIGATIVDGLDTLYLMGLMNEFREGRDWVAEHLNVNEVEAQLSVFETTIRFIGGLLSCYALTGDLVFKEKAIQTADALLPAFENPTGIPSALFHPVAKVSRHHQWTGSYSVLAEIGGLHLEFTYLSEISGNDVYKEKVDRIRKFLNDIEKPEGLYPNFIHAKTGDWQWVLSIGAQGDAFYEYLLKAWLMSGQTDEQARTMFDTAMQAALDKTLKVSSSGLSYLVDLRYFGDYEEKMDQMACYAGGMFALASATLKNSLSDRYMDVAKKLTHTCHESYAHTKTKLGPDVFRFTNEEETRRSQKSYEKAYSLRPEAFESYFILWRLTKDQKYRDWGWEGVQALEKYCRVEGGYTGLYDVNQLPPHGDDVQPTYFLAKTLKYLYLLFSDDSFLPLDQWVFNKQAHPLPIKGKNPLYRAYIGSENNL